MHLTNYAVNKHSDTYVVDDETGSKRYTDVGLTIGLSNVLEPYVAFVFMWEVVGPFLTLLYTQVPKVKQRNLFSAFSF